MSEVVVRRAGAADMAAVALLRWAWIVEEDAGSSDLTRDGFVAEFRTWAMRHATTHQCFVAEHRGTPIGMAWLALTDRVPSPRSMDRVNGDLQSVFVSPEFRGRGAGGRLIDAAMRAAAARGAERLVVHSSERAVGLYARAGLLPSELLRDRSLNIVD